MLRQVLAAIDCNTGGCYIRGVSRFIMTMMISLAPFFVKSRGGDLLPDWTYQTVFKPLLFRLAPETARKVTFKAIDVLSHLPLGLGIKLIQFMGHMEPPKSLRDDVMGISFSSPVGLASGLTLQLTGLKALSHFGFGFLEIGTVVTTGAEVTTRRVVRDTQGKALVYSQRAETMAVEEALQYIERQGPLQVPLGVRLGYSETVPPLEVARVVWSLMARMDHAADFFILDRDSAYVWTDDDWADFVGNLGGNSEHERSSKPLLTYVYPDDVPEVLEARINHCPDGLSGFVLGDEAADSQGNYMCGPQSKSMSIELIHRLRSLYGEKMAIIASGGVQDPADALDLLHAGADLVRLHSGFVYSGPGLPKRINEAVCYEKLQAASMAGKSKSSSPPPGQGWGWIALLGLGMIIGGLLAWWIAAGRVVLTYDERFVGWTRGQLAAFNERLLPFMSHDRITLAGTMISIGIVYWQLAVHGMRRRLHWARQALLISAFVGFSSFFLYLGFGYFDPLHALASLLLLPLFVLGILTNRSFSFNIPPPNLVNNWQWKLGQRGQLIAVLLGASLLIGGVVISYIGMTSVFVPEDLEFMCTSSVELQQQNELLISLIAHDRAGFGGALFSLGMAILLISLWGIRRGERWIWWTLLLSGLPGFVAGFGVHLSIGYTDLWHLTPAFFVVVLYAAGLICLYPYLCASSHVPRSFR